MIAIDCMVDGAERWVITAQADQPLRDEIGGRIEPLKRELAADH